MTDHSGTPGPELPDFSAGAGGHRGAGGPAGADGAPGADGADGADGRSGVGGDGRDGRAGRGPLLAMLLGGTGCLVVVLAIIALVLSQTVFKGATEETTAGGDESSAPTEDPETTRPPEYVPTEEQTDEAGAAQTTFAEQPTVDCTVHENTEETAQVDGAVRGGGLEFPAQDGWEIGNNWGSQGSYMVDQHFADQPVEDGWYTVAGVGRVDFPEEEGGYPGAQDAARAIFQCGLSREQVAEVYGSPPELTNYRDEAFTVDGHEAWIVTADVVLAETALLDSTDTWRLTVIVVDTPDGPVAFDGGAAIGLDQQVTDLEAMIEGLRVL